MGSLSDTIMEIKDTIYKAWLSSPDRLIHLLDLVKERSVKKELLDVVVSIIVNEGFEKLRGEVLSFNRYLRGDIIKRIKLARKVSKAENLLNIELLKSAAGYFLVSYVRYNILRSIIDSLGSELLLSSQKDIEKAIDRFMTEAILGSEETLKVIAGVRNIGRELGVISKNLTEICYLSEYLLSAVLFALFLAYNENTTRYFYEILFILKKIGKKVNPEYMKEIGERINYVEEILGDIPSHIDLKDIARIILVFPYIYRDHLNLDWKKEIELNERIYALPNRTSFELSPSTTMKFLSELGILNQENTHKPDVQSVIKGVIEITFVVDLLFDCYEPIEERTATFGKYENLAIVFYYLCFIGELL